MIGKLIILSVLVASFSMSSAFAALPNTSDLLHFDNSDDAKFIIKGESLITDQENPALQLNGFGDYLILDSNLPKKLNDFSISAWVKPDYRFGAPATQSIVSETHAFDLTINNDKIGKNIATFSVYDGIKWHHVDSKSEIKNTWTHLAATYSDETISIFVNGIKENSAKVDGGYSYTYTHGVGSQNSFDYIKSESKVLIGAFTPLLRADGVVENNFSGLLDDIGLYAISLSSTNVSDLYNKNRISPLSAPVIQEALIEETGTVNEFGFVASKNNANDQKIESMAYQGYKINKQDGGLLDEPKYIEVTKKKQVSSDSTTLIKLENEIPSKNVEPKGPTTPEHEKTVSVGQSIKKLVRVESGSTSTFSELPTSDLGIMYTWNLYGFENGSLVDFSRNPEVSFNLIDSNSDGVLDRGEWIVINNVMDFYLISEIL